MPLEPTQNAPAGAPAAAPAPVAPPAPAAPEAISPVATVGEPDWSKLALFKPDPASAALKTEPPAPAKPPEVPAALDPAKAEGEAAKAEGQPPEDGLGTSRLAPLVKRERALTVKEKDIKDREKALEEREGKLRAATPDEALKAVGWTMPQLLEFVANGQKLTPDQSAAAKSKSVESTLEEIRSWQKQRDEAEQQAQAKQAQEQVKTSVLDTIKGAPDKYETIRALGEEETVFNELVRHYRETGEVLPPAEVADHVEQYLAQREEQRLARLLTTKRFQGKIPAIQKAEPQRPASSSPPANQGQTDDASPRTLTNHLAATAPPRKTKTDDELLDEAARLVRFR